MISAKDPFLGALEPSGGGILGAVTVGGADVGVLFRPRFGKPCAEGLEAVGFGVCVDCRDVVCEDSIELEPRYPLPFKAFSFDPGNISSALRL